MKPFSKIKPKLVDEFSSKNHKGIKWSNDFMKVIEYEDWSLIEQKDAVFCIPYLIEKNQFIIRKEYIPTFKYRDGSEYHLALVGGGIEEGESPETALLRELQEEAGLVLSDTYKINFEPPFFFNKSQVNKVYFSIMNLTSRDYDEIPIRGDGSRTESLSHTVGVDLKYLNNLIPSDIITDWGLMKFRSYLNI
jgi:8-oxo-dGTP pyrophosphatase MutT (NUDIX family)